MKKYLLNYATREFIYSQKLLTKSALENGIDDCFIYGKDDLIKTDFYRNNLEILESKRGAGYWLWKPFYIYESLNKIDDGDILFYSDSGIKIIKDLNVLANLANKKVILLFVDGGLHRNREYTKRDCFISLGCDNQKYWDSYQLMASFQVYKKNKESMEFVKEWLEICCSKNNIDDSCLDNKINLDEFKEHRHDQSILSLLAIKNNIEIFRDPTQWGNRLKLNEFRENGEFIENKLYLEEFVYSNSSYPTLLNHHRKKINLLNYCLDRYGIKKM